MKAKLAGEPKFAKMKLVQVAYGEESEQVNQQQALALAQAFPDLKGIIVPAGIGLPAAARALEQAGLIDKIKLTGLAPATLMKKYIEAGQAQDIWWNVTGPRLPDLLRRAGLIAQCKITGKEGETFTAGRLGDYTVGADGEVVLGPAEIVTPDERRRVQVLTCTSASGPAQPPAPSAPASCRWRAAREPDRLRLATMADVALRAGVSISTVSHVLNGTRKVSPATVRAVEDGVAARLHAEHPGPSPGPLRPPTRSASRCRPSPTTISARSSRGIEAECTRHGADDPVLTDTHDDPASRAQGRPGPAPAPGRRHRSSLPVGRSGAACAALPRDHRIPTVLIDRLVTADFDQVGVENRRADDRAGGASGRRTATAASAWSPASTGLSTTMERVDGYQAGLARRRPCRSMPALVESGGSTFDPARAGRAPAARRCDPADRDRHRQQPDDHRRHARPARRRPPGAATTWRWSASTISTGPTASARA